MRPRLAPTGPDPGGGARLLALIFTFIGFCLFPFGIAALIEGIRALSKGRTRSGSSAQVMAIIAVCVAPIGPNRRLWPTSADPGWDALGFHPADPLYYSYEVSVTEDGKRFAVRARGDLDGDGIQSLFEREGVVEGNQIRGQPHPFVEHETE